MAIVKQLSTDQSEGVQSQHLSDAATGNVASDEAINAAAVQIVPFRSSNPVNQIDEGILVIFCDIFN